MDPHYLGYFECFNRQWFYEAHDVLEELWLAKRHMPEDGFYKGLIQFAGAFVHLQKNRLQPAAALFRLSRSYLVNYPATYNSLDLTEILRIIDVWLEALEKDQFLQNPLVKNSPPSLTINGLRA